MAGRRVCCTYHCSGCDACFSSLVAFDLHRSGSYEKSERHCVDPDEVTGDKPWRTLVVKTDAGFCDLKWGDPSENATIYQTAEAAQSSWAGAESPEALPRESTDLPMAA